ncbi:MAG: hypothetical protein HY22_00120 [[Candidatus Thermochlorobacteriaceae] bacterium GBChlB]|nr:MAG: hypothetical protein HY22_00120 [[Candidatus Thermochlorobacteriaceae] bacterium GBChlB]
MTKEEAHTPNIGFASGGVTCKLGALCFYSSSVQVDSFVLRNPPERKAPNRYIETTLESQTFY